MFKLVPNHARYFGELRDSSCTGFCRLIQYSDEAYERVNHLLFRMVLASLGSYHRNGVRSRAIGIISGTPALTVTDAYVGVCCSSLKKISASSRSTSWEKKRQPRVWIRTQPIMLR